MKKSFFFIVALYFFYLPLCTRGQAKSDTISFFTQREKFKQGLPYDKPFTMNVYFKDSRKVYLAFLYKNKGKKSFLESIRSDKNPDYYLAQMKFEAKGDSAITLYFAHDSASDKKKLLRIIRPFNEYSSILKPGNKYTLVFIRQAPGLLERLAEVGKAVDHTNGAVIADSLPALQVKIDRQRKQQEDLHIVYGPDAAVTYAKTYITQYLPVIKKIYDSVTGFNNNTIASCNMDTNIQLSYKYLTDPKLAYLKCVDTCKLDKIIKSLHNSVLFPALHNKKDFWPQLNAGLIALKDINDKFYLDVTKLVPLSQAISQEFISAVGNRGNNLSSSIDDLKEYIIYLTNLELALGNSGSADKEPIRELKVCIITIVANLQLQQNRISQIQALLKVLTDLLIGSEDFINTDVQAIDADIYSFTTRNELAITPVFGYSYYGFQKNFGSFTPYLGFQINFQPMDRDVPFRRIPDKTLMQRLAFVTAWTLTPIGSDNKTYDLFSNGSSLLTGIGFKLSHVVMLNGGTIWFKKANTNPLLTDKKIAITPFVSLSVHTEISKLLNGFTSLIPSK